jgi:hypothetical protein
MSVGLSDSYRMFDQKCVGKTIEFLMLGNQHPVILAGKRHEL